PTLSQLRAFVAVAEYRHFGAAANHLGVSQPTLSQALAALETGLGVQLIERSTRMVVVTAEGRVLLARALDTLEAAEGFSAAAAADLPLSRYAPAPGRGPDRAAARRAA